MNHHSHPVPYGTRQLRNGRRTVIYGEEPFYYETVAFRVAPGGAITSEYVQNDGTVLAPQYFNYKFDYGIGVVYVAGELFDWVVCVSGGGSREDRGCAIGKEEGAELMR